jgi:tRNA(Ile)-lysidine synthase
MEAQFLSHIQKKLPYIQSKKLLLAVSGGLDSMVLFHLCKQDGDIAIAHCNFRLRGIESDAETTFVQQTAKEAGVHCHIGHFDTYAYAKEKKLSTQMAARQLRYNWFQDLARENGYDYILTAHHLNDSAETLLINLSRGTGLKGLAGIPVKNGNIVRPLLPFSRKQIKEYALSKSIQWKEDSSNASDDYLRNAIRLNAIPALEKETPSFLEGVRNTQEYLKQSVSLLGAYKEYLKQTLCYPLNSVMGPSGFCIDLEKLSSHDDSEAVLFLLLNDYGFTSWQDIYDLKDAQSGKKVNSATHYIFKDRATLQVVPLEEEKIEQSVYWIEKEDRVYEVGNLQLSCVEVASRSNGGKNEIFVDKDRLNYPLQIRTWKEGDYFFPLGLKGKKKLSKFFKDEKLSLIEKEHVLVMCSDQDIVWILGMRPDDRFKVTDTTKTILKISYHTNEV